MKPRLSRTVFAVFRAGRQQTPEKVIGFANLIVKLDDIEVWPIFFQSVELKIIDNGLRCYCQVVTATHVAQSG